MAFVAIFFKTIKKFVKIKKKFRIFFITKNIFQNFEIYIFRKIPKFKIYEKYIFQNFLKLFSNFF